MDKNKIIMYDSPEAATYKTDIKGWVSANGRFCGNDEHSARYDGCTHRKCLDCDNTTQKKWLICDECRLKERQKIWESYPHQDWDEQTMIALFNGNIYFRDSYELEEWLYDHEMNGEDVRLVICEPIYYPELTCEYFSNDTHEDWEPEKELIDAINQLNKVTKRLPAHSWIPGKIRTSYNYILNKIKK